MALNNSQYERVMRGYQERQFAHLHRLDERTQEVKCRIPAYEPLVGRIKELSLKLARVKLMRGKAAGTEGRDGEEKRLLRELQELRERREALLLSGGFPADYMELTYTCPICRDTGYVEGKKCSCLRQAEIAILYGQSNLAHMLETDRFSGFSMDYYDEELIVDERTGLRQPAYMKQIYEECRRFAGDFEKKGGNLLFTGPAGTGKTFLTNCIAGELLDRSAAVLYLTAGDLFQLLSDKRFDRGEEDREEKYQGVLSCDLLIIDDLGTELTNSFTTTELFYLINGRLREKKGTLISTNLSMNELRDTYSDRIISRIISGYRIIPLYGSDIRIRKKLCKG